MSEGLRLTFHGVRGSYPVAGPTTLRFGGNTSCILVEYGRHRVILDAGTGIVALGRKLLDEHFASGDQGALHCTVLLTHSHYDHVQGLPFFAPLYMGQATVHILAPRTSNMLPQEVMERLFASPFFPVDWFTLRAQRLVEAVHETDGIFFLRGEPAPRIANVVHPDLAQALDPQEVDMAIYCLRGLNHPKDGVNIYRLEAGGKSVVLATDTEGFVGVDRRLVAFAKGADLLIHDAQCTQDLYTATPLPMQGFGHSTVAMACKVAQMAQVARLVLYHHDPASHDDDLDLLEQEALGVFPHSVAAREGLSIQL